LCWVMTYGLEEGVRRRRYKLTVAQRRGERRRHGGLTGTASDGDLEWRATVSWHQGSVGWRPRVEGDGELARGEAGWRRRAARHFGPARRQEPVRGDREGEKGGGQRKRDDASVEMMMAHGGMAHLVRRGVTRLQLASDRHVPTAALTRVGARGQAAWQARTRWIEPPRSANQHAVCGRLAADRRAPHASSFSE
jgi:hypothetical protein